MLKSHSYTPAIHNGISEIRKIRLGQLDQYILIRGENIHNPVLLYLHSGPGTTEMISFRKAHRKLEKYFTVVYWEQRGTGKSYSSRIPEASMTIEQLVSDAHELAEYLKEEFGKEKIVVVGHSWGTALGLRLVQKYPDSFYAYVGSGQEVKPSEGEKISYRYTLEKARGNASAMRELKSLDSPAPYLTIDNEGNWLEKLKIERKWLVKFGGETYGRSDNSLLFNLGTIMAPEYTWMDYIRFGTGSSYSLKRMWPEIMQLDFFRQIPEVKVPVYFFQGRHDYNTPSTLVEKYFNNIKAPYKELVWFENSGHHPMYEEPDKYDNNLIEKILPLCK
ncbi:MAG: alpha/beta hydrolase [Bacillota bacterium]|nr:alpha/beta hydrolase [Bacillota bacterium]